MGLRGEKPNLCGKSAFSDAFGKVWVTCSGRIWMKFGMKMLLDVINKCLKFQVKRMRKSWVYKTSNGKKKGFSVFSGCSGLFRTAYGCRNELKLTGQKDIYVENMWLKFHGNRTSRSRVSDELY